MCEKPIEVRMVEIKGESRKLPFTRPFAEGMFVDLDKARTPGHEGMFVDLDKARRK